MSKRIKNLIPKLPFGGASFNHPAPSSSPDFVIEHIPSKRMSSLPQSVSPFKRSASVGHTHPLSHSHNKHSPNSNANNSDAENLPQQSAFLSTPSPQVVTHQQQKLIELVDTSHCLFSLEYLNSLRVQGEFCDVMFRVSDTEVHAHRNILTGSTTYFEGMFIGEFSEPYSQEPIEIEDIDATSFTLLLSYIYTGRIQITDENVFGLFTAAVTMNFPSLFETCNRFMFQILSPSNCIRIRRLAKEYECRALVLISEEYLRQNFVLASKESDFLLLPPSELLEVIQMERISLESEEVMYEIVMQWVSEEPKKRLVETSLLFPQIRFHKMNAEFLDSVLLDPRLANYQDAIQRVESAIKKKKQLKEGQESVPPVPTKRGCKGTVLYREKPLVYSSQVVDVFRCGGLLGIKLLGGVDRPTHVLRREDPPGVYITEIQPFGAAHRYPDIQVGDRILAINGISLEQAAHSDVIQLLSICPDPVRLLIRHEPLLLGLRDVTLTRQEHETFGIELAGQELSEGVVDVVISRVLPEGTAARDGRIEVGLSVLHINATNFSQGTLGGRQGNSVIMCSGEQLHLLLTDRRLELEPSYLNFIPDLMTSGNPPAPPRPRVRMRANTSLQIPRHKADPAFKPTPAVRTSFNVFPSDSRLSEDRDSYGLSFIESEEVDAESGEVAPFIDAGFPLIAVDDSNPYSRLTPKPDDPILSISPSLVQPLDSVQEVTENRTTVTSWDDDISDNEDM